MTDLSFLLVAFFLPLFPLSIGFNALFAAIRHPLLRLALLLGWPLTGILLFQWLQPQVPQWLIPWALASAFLYAFRLLAMREVGLWTGFLATSVWACLWLPLLAGDRDVALYAVWFGVPLAMLALLVHGLEKRFGAAYSELYGGLAQTIPRFSGLFVISVLAVTATPVFPAFLVMLKTVLTLQPLYAVVFVVIWALWSWAGMRLIQGMVVGDPSEAAREDTSLSVTFAFSAAMLALILAGFILTGDF